MRRLGALLLTSLAATPAAGDLPLQTPVDCSLGVDCYIQQTVDHDSGPGASDFQCGPLTYDGHKGTDFALPSLSAMHAGVDVLAAAAGVVVGVRDGMTDARQIGPDAPDVIGRECGNGVVLQHADGWETQYCHLKKGSVAVTTRDRVEAGDVLGQIGLSGQTQFPHLHLSVRKDDKVIDPFAPDGNIACDAPVHTTLWVDNLDMQPGGLITAGFASAVPDYEDIKQGSAASDVIAADQPLVVWGYAFGGRPGDTIHLRIEGPQGHVMDESTALDKNQSQLFRAIGRKAPDGGWAPGNYVGEIQMIRDGIVLDATQTLVFVVPPR